MPIAFPRSSLGKTTITIERVAGITKAAPNPIAALAIITSFDESA